mgnify:FL=1
MIAEATQEAGHISQPLGTFVVLGILLLGGVAVAVVRYGWSDTVHNVVAHPLLSLCPPLGQWLHVRTEPAAMDDPLPPAAPAQRQPVTLLLDVWCAMGGDSQVFHTWWAEDPSFPDRWSQMVAAIGGNISALASDSNPPAGALFDLAVRFQQNAAT